MCVTKISCRKNKIVEKQHRDRPSFVYIGKTGNCLCDVGSDVDVKRSLFFYDV